MIKQFERELYGKFVEPTPEYVHYYDLWLAYYRTMDNYDRGLAFPRDQGISGGHAHQVFKRIFGQPRGTLPDIAKTAQMDALTESERCPIV